ncbi:MAG: 2-dehydro-3-deoxy-6-phosphogalactonate aldolase [Geminicoccaceae bacterium]
MSDGIDPHLAKMPLVAIMRGLRPDEAIDRVGVLVELGFRVIEVPLNSPHPLTSIERLVHRFGDQALIGAGTVLMPRQVDELADAGGRLVIAPNLDSAVMARAGERGFVRMPGVATPSEAFAAIAQGIRTLKLFPAETLPPAAVKAWRAVVPADVWLLPVGGITATGMAAYRNAGANGFGLGSALFRPGEGRGTLRRNAEAFVNAWNGSLSV